MNIATALNNDDYTSVINETTFHDPNSLAESCGNATGFLNNFPYELPASEGKAGNEESIDETGTVASGYGKVTFSQFASLGQEYRDYYINMRWNYTDWNWNGTNTGLDQEQLAWFREKPRLIQVTNPRTGKTIIAAALETGPAPWTGVDRQSNNDPKQGWTNPQHGTPEGYTGRVAGFPPKAVEALGMQQGLYDGSGDVLTYQWAANQDAKPGPVESADSCGSAGAAGENGWSITGAGAMTLFFQVEEPWASSRYGIGTIEECGCGPTSLAMAIQSLTGNGTDPKKMANYFASHGGQISNDNCGSNWIWGSDSFQKDNGVTVTQIAPTEQAMMDALKRGSFVIMSQGRGFFTNGGHIMLLRGFTNDGNFLVADPYSKAFTERAEGFTPFVIIGDGSEDPAGRQGTHGFLKSAWEINL